MKSGVVAVVQVVWPGGWDDVAVSWWSQQRGVGDAVAAACGEGVCG